MKPCPSEILTLLSQTSDWTRGLDLLHRAVIGAHWNQSHNVVLVAAFMIFGNAETLCDEVKKQEETMRWQ